VEYISLGTKMYMVNGHIDKDRKDKKAKSANKSWLEKLILSRFT
jgi:hypothetical protein